MRAMLPRNLMGQMLLAVALALLLVQGIGAILVYRAQSERHEAGIAQTAAYRLMASDRPERGFGDRRGPRGRGMRVQLVERLALPTSAERDPALERAVSSLLAERGAPAREVRVARYPLMEEPAALRRATRRAERRGEAPPDAGQPLVAVAVQAAQGGPWQVVRLPQRANPRQIAIPLLLQTALIYLVVIAVIALILRRITRPLAQLTSQVTQFARDPASHSPIEPSGPGDVRALIGAQNAMQARIAALLDEKDVMLGAIGHDLKTPLAALRVRIESVDDDTEREKMAATIEDIAASLDDILALARVGRPTDAPERSELSALLASVVEEYEDMGEPVVLAEGPRVVAPVRETWLRRAVRNLVGNALRYGGEARVSLQKTGSEAIVAVEDRGPGIPEEEIAAMMEPFARGDPSRNRSTGGAGLGLALARAIAEQHGGALALSNRAEGGLRAEIRLPV